MVATDDGGRHASVATEGGTPAGSGAGDGTSDAEPASSSGVTRVVDGIDAFQQRHRALAVPIGVGKKFGEDRAGSLAALIAYYGFFSLFPLLLVLVTVLGMVLEGNPSLQERILDSAIAQFPVIGSRIRENTGRLDTSGFALFFGLATALWAGLGVMRAAQTAMDDVWDVPAHERPNILVQVLRALAMLLVLGVGIVATTILTGLAGDVTSGTLGRAAGMTLSAVLLAGVALVGFRILTTHDVTWRALLPGAAVAGVAALVLQLLGGYLLDRQVRHASDVYGTFAVVLGLLWWLYLQAQIVLVAAELNVVLARRLWPRSLRPPRTEADRRALALRARVEELIEPEEVDVEVGGHRVEPAEQPAR